MSTRPSDRRVDPIDGAFIESRLREISAELPPRQWLDDLETRHLVRVVTECSLLLTDVYSDDRVDRIMHPERGHLSSLLDRLIEEERKGEGEVLYHVRRLPDDVRVIGDKALFDAGFRGLRRIKGYELTEIGPRAYRAASEVLELLAEDRRLGQFFRHNRLLTLPLEDEVLFLRTCAERFPLYVALLSRVQQRDGDQAEWGSRLLALGPAPEPKLLVGREPGVTTAGASGEGEREAKRPEPLSDRDYVDAARGRADTGAAMSTDELLSAYERMVLFAALDLDRLRRALSSIVVDQDLAVRTLCDEFSLFAAGTRDLRKPSAYFLVGPTGVGKNHLVETLCRLLEGIWGVDVPMLTIEGPSYTYPSDINELKGATRGFIRSDEEGILTTFHEKSSRAPFSVILVDEVEKAHPQLRTFFLSIMDRGTTTDNRGRVLNFSNSMIFFTSNLGYSDAQQRSSPVGFIDEQQRETHVDREIAVDLRRALKPEFVNRVRMVHFRRLSRASAERILDLELAKIERRYREVHDIRLVLSDTARELFIERGFSSQYGARHMAALLETVCNVEIAKRVRRDDARRADDRRQVVDWLRALRERGGAVDLEDVRRRVVETTRARLDYDSLEIAVEDGEFVYRPMAKDGEVAT